MTQPCDGCICGLYLSNTCDPIVKNNRTPDNPLDASALARMGVVKGLLKHTGGSYIHNYTMFVPDVADPIRTYSKVFR
jgi:hypothetical protein